MKKIVKKRIILYCPWTKEEIIGAEEYDSTLSDESILGAFHEVGKTQWCPTHPDFDELWYLRAYKEVRLPYYKVLVEEFYTEVPTFWDRIVKALQ